MRLDESSRAVITEYWRLQDRRENIFSDVEGYGLLFISMTNLLQAINENQSKQVKQEKAVNLAANALRFLTDCL